MHIIKNNIFLGLIEITVRGLWTPQEFEGFARDLSAAIKGFPGPRPPMSLYNFTEAAMQPQFVVAQMQAMARNADPERSIALYTEGCLARQQAKRVAAEANNMQVFESRVEALSWLAARRRALQIARPSLAGSVGSRSAVS